MKLILKKTVTHLGQPGDLVTVARGYARNYLIPKGFAMEATKSNLRVIEQQLTKLKAAAAEQEAAARELANRLAQLELSFERKVADPEIGTLYGSVSVLDIGNALEERGFEIDRGGVHLEHPIKHLGQHDVRLALTHGVFAELVIRVVGEDGQTEPLGSQAPDTAAADTSADKATASEVEAAGADAEESDGGGSGGGPEASAAEEAPAVVDELEAELES